jgi:hypothetical protein
MYLLLYVFFVAEDESSSISSTICPQLYRMIAPAAVLVSVRTVGWLGSIGKKFFPFVVSMSPNVVCRSD